jgi:hypothetical protein
VISPYQCQLPLEEYKKNLVVVYYYSGRWVPIMFYTLEAAIALYHKAILEGREILVFPPNVKPCELEYSFDTVVNQKTQPSNVIRLSEKTKLEKALGLQSLDRFRS